MRSSRSFREFSIFIGGVVLGIIGNLFVESLMAYLYPDGIIPENDAFSLMIGSGAMIILEIIAFSLFIWMFQEEKSSFR